MQKYIDFEVQEGSRERARQLYERLLERTQHVKVWTSYGHFEAMPLPQLQQEAQAFGEANGEAAAPADAGSENADSLLSRSRRWAFELGLLGGFHNWTSLESMQG